ncbi:uncharacterized protein LOC119261785 [Pygocentrus nattereri]|uniref:uncharacterized protein LOC119261784 n=1 Tax=Pygocentrus nattereri TaxID=42514 RepID=UPI001891D866|nr:uncharacterized protein LOC119261784 [Pygocentrus nattereri]XP_037387420.1 uncharacterized protein LOC119261785 [Pygocentrus nattereri]
MDAIPIVDFGEYKLRDDEDDAVPGERLQELREEVRRAFTEVGFVYLKNTGIEQDEVRAPRVLSAFGRVGEKSDTFHPGSQLNRAARGAGPCSWSLRAPSFSPPSKQLGFSAFLSLSPPSEMFGFPEFGSSLRVFPAFLSLAPPSEMFGFPEFGSSLRVFPALLSLATPSEMFGFPEFGSSLRVFPAFLSLSPPSEMFGFPEFGSSLRVFPALLSLATPSEMFGFPEFGSSLRVFRLS